MCVLCVHASVFLCVRACCVCVSVCACACMCNCIIKYIPSLYVFCVCVCA